MAVASCYSFDKYIITSFCKISFYVENNRVRKIRCISWVDPKFGTLVSEYVSFYGEVYVKVVLKSFDITCQKFPK